MKKLSMILSAVLAAAMAVPTVANAKNSYPAFPTLADGIKYIDLTDEEQEAYHEGFSFFKEELCAAYQNGEYDWDFNLDGEVTLVDFHYPLVYYAELMVGIKEDTFVYYTLSDCSDWEICEINDEMRERVVEDGDLNGDGVVTAMDVSYMLMAYYSDKDDGDVNADGYVDARDASALLAYYSSQSVGGSSDFVTEKKMEYLGDVNGDGAINASDASAILKAYSSNAVAE